MYELVKYEQQLTIAEPESRALARSATRSLTRRPVRRVTVAGGMEGFFATAKRHLCREAVWSKGAADDVRMVLRKLWRRVNFRVLVQRDPEAAGRAFVKEFWRSVIVLK